MSLTSYRAAPPRVNFRPWGGPAGPGSDLLFRALRRSTIGAEGFHGRVRDGIGCFAPRYGHQAMQALPRRSEEHTSELQSRPHLVCRLLLEKKKQFTIPSRIDLVRKNEL